MSDKWVTIFVVSVILSLVLPVLTYVYQNGECKNNAIKMKYASEEIQKICK